MRGHCANRVPSRGKQNSTPPSVTLLSGYRHGLRRTRHLEREKWRGDARGCLAFGLHRVQAVSETTTPVPDRRSNVVNNDRRRNSRSGRRKTDPHTNWRRIAWLFALYAAYLSIRSLPSTVKTFFKRTTSQTS
jgi:hypothetical protein